MTDIFMDLKNGEWIETSREDSYKDYEGNPFSLNAILKSRLDILNNLVKDDWDGMFIIDGKERSGKSNLACSCAWYLTKGRMTLDNFASGLEDCAKKIEILPDRSVLILDEGSIMFGSKDSTSKAQKQLIKIFDVVGQKNIIFIVCLPSFFDLNKTIAVRRSLFLLHIKPKELKDSWKREPFYYFDERAKSILYREGKKNYDSYKFPHPTFDGKYYKFKPPFWPEYEEMIKKKSMQEVLDNASKETGKNSAYINRINARNIKLIQYLKETHGLSNEKIAKICGVGQATIGNILRDYSLSKGQIGVSVTVSPPMSDESSKPYREMEVMGLQNR